MESETEREGMDKLQTSSDSMDIMAKKRLRAQDSEDEIVFPARKRSNSFNEQSRGAKNNSVEISLNKNNTDEWNVKEEKNKKVIQEIASDLDTDKENWSKRDDKLKRENRNESLLEENNVALSNNIEETDDEKKFFETKIAGMKENEIIKRQVDETIGGKTNGEEDRTRNYSAKEHKVDTEVVGGLELSVECASDKDESSSESKDEQAAKPRSRTIIVKAEPDESELDCSSNEEKFDSRQAPVSETTLDIKTERSKTKKRDSRTTFTKSKASGSDDSRSSNSADEDYSPRAKKRDSRTTFTKSKASGSDDSRSSNSADEDYSPRAKKRTKGSPMTAKKSTNHRSNESKTGRSTSMRGNVYKKSVEYTSDEDEDTDADVTAIEKKADKTAQIKNGIEEKKSWSKNESNDNLVNKGEERFAKGKGSRGNTKPKERKIQILKRYLNIAGVKIRSHILSDCKNDAARIERLKKLLEQNGVTGRPTLEKCKRVRKENERLKEISELDTSNIISEARMTRARKNMENIKKTLLDTPRHREVRSTFKRIQTVIDSDSE